jgi:hypothetical protein
MAISIFPIPSQSSLNSDTYFLEVADTLYVAKKTFEPGVYVFSHTDFNTTCYIEFFNGLTSLGTTQTVSRTITYNLASTATSFRVYQDSLTNVLLKVELNSSNAFFEANGTLDTITSSGTYNQTGELFVVLVGAGGGGGRGGTSGNNKGTGGGGSGGIQSTTLVANTSTSVTVGAGGTGANAENVNGNSGGLTAFGSIQATGGGGGRGGTINQGLQGNAGLPDGGQGGANNVSTGSPPPRVNGPYGGQASNASNYPYVKRGSTGGGGGAGYMSTGAGAGSGIGTGGNSNWNVNTARANSGTGKGSGGGGSFGAQGGDGADGAIFVLRGIAF